MNSNNQLNVNLDVLFQSEGMIHAFCISKDYVCLHANAIQKEFIKLIANLPADEDIINQPLSKIFRNVSSDFLPILQADYRKVLDLNLPQQFIHKLNSKNMGEIKILSAEWPYYNEKNELIGVMGIAQYLTRFFLPESFKGKLSKKQAECVQLLLDNHTTQQIADIMNISRRTVESYLNFVKLKFDCRTNAELLMKLVHSRENTLENVPLRNVQLDKTP